VSDVLSAPVLAAGEGFTFAGGYAFVALFAGIALLLAVRALTVQHDRTFTAAVVYLALGALASLALRPLGVNLFDPLDDPAILEHLTEFGVIVALFATGLKLDRRLTWRGWRSPALLLGVVMPVTIGAIALWGVGVMGLSLGAAIILGAALAPTDPVLAQDVAVGPPGEAEEPEPKFALTAEAGLNDGLAYPFVWLGVFVAAEGGTSWLGEWLLADVLYGVAVGLALGALVGTGAAALVLRLRERGALHAHFDGWIAIGIVAVTYGVTEIAGAYGFLAVFVAGLAFRRWERDHEVHESAHTAIEHIEKFAELALVLLLGTYLTLSGLGEPGLAGWLLIPVLLVVVRPLATVAALTPVRMPLAERAFVGWFGVRGVGSLYYVAVALGAGVLSEGEAAVVFWTVVACAAVSIVVHGLTSTRLTRKVVEEA
jgi:NhaP-type Na+/H+ or K+/H+ antiporter